MKADWLVGVADEDIKAGDAVEASYDKFAGLHLRPQRTTPTEIPPEVAELCHFTSDWEPYLVDENKCYMRSSYAEARFQKRIDGGWDFDEVVGTVSLHIEQMDDSYYWIGISDPQGGEHRLCVDIGSVSRRAAVNMKGWTE